MELTIEQVRNLLQTYLISNKLEDYLIKISPGCRKSDGYVSYIYKITFDPSKESLQNSTIKPELIIKCAPINLQYRQLMSVRKLYLSEIYFYEKILPEFLQLQEGNVPNSIFRVPKFITALKDEFKETIVLENICNRGYSMWNKQKPMDEIHLNFILKEYGKFHAFSLCLKHKNRQVYDEIVQDLKNIHQGQNCNLNDSFYNWFRPALNQTINLFENNKYKSVKEKVCNLRNNLEIIMNKVFEYDGIYDVIAHNDCWSNNMLFKYLNCQPIKMYLLDFRYVYKTSPVVDISYFFYVSAAKEEYLKLDYYLQVYYQSLNETCNNLNINLNEIYPWKEFKKEWVTYAKYGFLRGILGIPLSLRDEENTIDVKDVVDKGIQTEKAFGDQKWSLECCEWIKTLTLHMSNNNFI